MLLEIVSYQYAIAPAIVGAIIAGASALASGIGSGVAQKKQQRRQNQMNMDMARYQNSLNIEQWNRENEYNTPVAQMQRLKEAGVNPRIWWSNGSNVSASSPTLSAPEQQYTAVGGSIARSLSDAFGTAVNTINQINQINQQNAQIDLIRSQTKHYDTLSELNKINSSIKSAENIMKSIDLNYYDLSQRQRVYGKQLTLNNMLANYLNNFGMDTLTLNDHNMLSVDPYAFRETPMMSIRRNQIASTIALANAKAVESAWNSKAKEKGIQWLSKRMYTEKLRQNLMFQQYGLLYNKNQNEITRGDILRANKDLMVKQKDFVEKQIERIGLENMNYWPVLGDLSQYTHLFFR